MGKLAREKYDAQRKARLDADAKRGANKFGLSRPPKARPSNYRAPLGFEVNSKGNAIVGSRIYRTPQVRGHDMSVPLLNDDTLQVSDLFMPREELTPEVRKARRTKRATTPSFERPKGRQWVEIRDTPTARRLYPDAIQVSKRVLRIDNGSVAFDDYGAGDRTWCIHTLELGMQFERREYRSAVNGRTRWTYSEGEPLIASAKRIKYGSCIGTLPPITYVDCRAAERATLQAMVDAFNGAIQLDLVEYMTRDTGQDIALPVPVVKPKRKRKGKAKGKGKRK